MATSDRRERTRLAERSILFTIVTASLLLIVAVASDVTASGQSERVATLRMPCLADMPSAEFRVVLDVLSQHSPGSVFAIYERTTADGSGFNMAPDFFPVQIEPADAWQEYVLKNYECRRIPDVATRNPIVHAKDFRRSHQKAFWPWFHERLGEKAVVVHVSRVGFSADSSEAILAVGVSCGVLCGGGELIRARWDGARWKIVQSLRTWVS